MTNTVLFFSLSAQSPLHQQLAAGCLPRHRNMLHSLHLGSRQHELCIRSSKNNFEFCLHNTLYNNLFITSQVSSTFSDLNSSQSTKKALLITFIVLTCVSFVGACIMFFFTFKSFQRLRFQNEHESNSLEEPILQGNQKNFNSSSNNNNTGSIERTFNEKNANIQAQD